MAVPHRQLLTMLRSIQLSSLHALSPSQPLQTERSKGERTVCAVHNDGQKNPKVAFAEPDWHPIGMHARFRTKPY